MELNFFFEGREEIRLRIYKSYGQKFWAANPSIEFKLGRGRPKGSRSHEGVETCLPLPQPPLYLAIHLSSHLPIHHEFIVIPECSLPDVRFRISHQVVSASLDTPAWRRCVHVDGRFRGGTKGQRERWARRRKEERQRGIRASGKGLYNPWIHVMRLTEPSSSSDDTAVVSGSTPSTVRSFLSRQAPSSVFPSSRRYVSLPRRAHARPILAATPLPPSPPSFPPSPFSRRSASVRVLPRQRLPPSFWCPTGSIAATEVQYSNAVPILPPASPCPALTRASGRRKGSERGRKSEGREEWLACVCVLLCVGMLARACIAG